MNLSEKLEAGVKLANAGAADAEEIITIARRFIEDRGNPVLNQSTQQVPEPPKARKPRAAATAETPPVPPPAPAADAVDVAMADIGSLD